MLTKSKEHNPNYLCKVFRIEGLKKHPNADRLQMLTVDFNTVITGMDAKEGDICIYFPLECKINPEFLSYTNSFRNYYNNRDYIMSSSTRKNMLDLEDNKLERKIGFFDDNCRVRAMRLRGEKSMGYIVPASVVLEWAAVEPKILPDLMGMEFDTINGLKLVEKYIVKANEPRKKEGKKPSVSRLVDGQVRLHIDTENLRKNSHKIKPDDTISITYKTHGTSWWVSNVLVKRRLSWLERLVKKLGLKVQEHEYDLVYGSRRVVKNQSMDDPKQKDHFFGYDLWEDIKDHIGKDIPKGFTLYGEMLGYDRNGKAIQNGYDYGCVPNGEPFKTQSKLEVYRITYTNPDGHVFELKYPQIKEFCDKMGLNPPHLYFWGRANDWLDLAGGYSDRDWQEAFVRELEAKYNDRVCFMCNNQVPEEGVVVRKESLFHCEPYKLKSFTFLEWESKELDKGKSDIESEN